MLACPLQSPQVGACTVAGGSKVAERRRPCLGFAGGPHDQHLASASNGQVHLRRTHRSGLCTAGVGSSSSSGINRQSDRGNPRALGRHRRHLYPGICSWLKAETNSTSSTSHQASSPVQLDARGHAWLGALPVELSAVQGQEVRARAEGGVEGRRVRCLGAATGIARCLRRCSQSLRGARRTLKSVLSGMLAAWQTLPASRTATTAACRCSIMHLRWHTMARHTHKLRVEPRRRYLLWLDSMPRVSTVQEQLCI